MSRQFITGPRNYIICIVAILVAVGIIMIYSSSITSGIAGRADSGLLRQLLFVLVSGLAFVAAMFFPYRKLEFLAVPLLVAGGLLLAGVLVWGPLINGARRWYRVGPLSFQPSDFAKLALIIFAARFLADRRAQDNIRSFRRTFLEIVAVTGAVTLLILAEPDFGTAVLIGVVIVAMMIVAGVPLRYVAGLGVLAAPAMYYMIASSYYRYLRLVSFFDPWKYARSHGYQLIHSYYALAAGGGVGVGIGEGRQKLAFLPGAGNDFIYSVIGEELGLVGCLIALALFVFLLWQGMAVARRAPSPFGSMLAFGITTMVTLQALLNVAVVTGSVPTKGIALPFISSGGSSLLFMMIGAGILVNIAGAAEAGPIAVEATT